MAKTILLADDSTTIQKVVELTFMDQDYQVVAVSDGNTAVAKLQELTPDLVIADVHMPGLGGYDVCRQVKQAQPQIPVLLLVGTFEQFDEGEAQACGAQGHLKKPFDSQELLTQVADLIAAAGSAEPAPLAAAPAPFETPTLDSPASFDAPALEAPSFAPPAFDAAPVADAAATFQAEAPSFDSGTGFEASVAEPLPVPEASFAPEPAPLPEASFAPEPVTPEPELVEPAPAPVVEAEPPQDSAPAANGSLSDDDIERIAQRVAALVGESAVKDVAWEVVPDLAEVVIKERIRELESQVD
ncbi:MAG: response regulator [Acidobacteriota bacterium]